MKRGKQDTRQRMGVGNGRNERKRCLKRSQWKERGIWKGDRSQWKGGIDRSSLLYRVYIFLKKKKSHIIHPLFHPSFIPQSFYFLYQLFTHLSQIIFYYIPSTFPQHFHLFFLALTFQKKICFFFSHQEEGSYIDLTRMHRWNIHYISRYVHVCMC